MWNLKKSNLWGAKKPHKTMVTRAGDGGIRVMLFKDINLPQIVHKP